ncbi:MAG TPA: preprotein translocase subunit YajC [Desulfatiglandales bacterium]|nr:preprotein translocase subunit YajC [Desulfatiglandales bacterium]
MDFLAYAANGTTTGTSLWANPIWMILIMFAIFYFLLIRPQQKERKKHEGMLATLKKGDKVITSGGLHGEISGIKDDVITIEIAPKVRVQVSRRFIAGLLK